MEKTYPRSCAMVVAATLCVTNALGGAAFAATVFDAVDDFSTVSNSDASTWSNRFSTDDTRDGSYALLTGVSDFLPFWNPVTPYWNIGDVTPGIGANQSGAPITFVGNEFTFFWADDTVWMHPGESGLAVLSWLSPFDGVFDISFSFADMDPNGLNPVHTVLGNGIEWFVDINDFSGVLAQGTIAETGSPTGLMTLTNISLFAGDRVNFVVSANGNHNFDSTEVTARIQAVPEPSSLGIGLLGFICVSSVRILHTMRRATRQNEAEIPS